MRGNDKKESCFAGFCAANASLSSDNFLCVCVCIPAEHFCIIGKFGGLSYDIKKKEESRLLFPESNLTVIFQNAAAHQSQRGRYRRIPDLVSASGKQMLFHCRPTLYAACNIDQAYRLVFRTPVWSGDTGNRHRHSLAESSPPVQDSAQVMVRPFAMARSATAFSSVVSSSVL